MQEEHGAGFCFAHSLARLLEVKAVLISGCELQMSREDVSVNLRRQLGIQSNDSQREVSTCNSNGESRGS